METLDASVALKWVLSEPDSDKARVIRDELRAGVRAIEIAEQARIGVYDCLYVALAEREGCEFITADRRLVGVLQPDFPFIVDLATLT